MEYHMNMDPTTEILLNMTKQLGLLSAETVNIKEMIQSFRAELAELKKDVRDHEDVHFELAPKRDLDALHDSVRGLKDRVTKLEQAPAQKALDRDNKTRDQLWSIAVGLVGLAGIGALLYAIAQNIINGAK
jgi:uncharacterized coiled-coil DUF342 family protein